MARDFIEGKKGRRGRGSPTSTKTVVIVIVCYTLCGCLLLAAVS
jgi:hypothetical protein